MFNSFIDWYQTYRNFYTFSLVSYVKNRNINFLFLSYYTATVFLLNTSSIHDTYSRVMKKYFVRITHWGARKKKSLFYCTSWQFNNLFYWQHNWINETFSVFIACLKLAFIMRIVVKKITKTSKNSINNWNSFY